MPVPTIDQLPQPPSRDKPANFAALADAFLAALVTLGAQINAVVTYITGAVAAAAASAASAINAPGTSATSTTQVAIGTGSKTFAVQAGKAFVVGQFVTAAQTSAPGNWMVGQITAYDAGAGSLSLTVTALSGGGTIGDWTIGLSAPTQFVAASAAEIWVGTNNTHPMTAASLVAAAAPQALVDTATVAVDFAAGANFTLTLGGSRTLANPANPQPGDGGVIILTQDSAGSRSLAFGSAWKFPGGAPSLSATAGAVDVISYFVVSPTLILCTLARGLA